MECKFNVVTACKFFLYVKLFFYYTCMYVSQYFTTGQMLQKDVLARP